MTEPGGDVEASFALVTQAFASDPDVASGGRGFGSGGLKVNGKLFALVSSRGEFVVKLPRQRVLELVTAGAAQYFDAGRGRPMKEWAAIDLAMVGDKVALAREAHRYVRGVRG
jgi:TfoX/Sxy family transcriptional regulator of competence genes